MPRQARHGSKVPQVSVTDSAHSCHVPDANAVADSARARAYPAAAADWYAAYEGLLPQSKRISPKLSSTLERLVL